jgi:hypothetical protein
VSYLLLIYPGGLAGAASRTVVNPLERAKIIYQVQAVPIKGGARSATGQAYTGLWTSLVRMWKDEGVRGLMKGNGINVVRVSDLGYPPARAKHTSSSMLTVSDIAVCVATHRTSPC